MKAKKGNEMHIFVRISAIKKIALMVYLSIFSLYTYSNNSLPSIVFVHIGAQLPVYIQDSVLQARLFNPQTSIYLIANQCALQEKKEYFDTITCINCEDLPQSAEHTHFLNNSTLNNSLNGFWRKTTERFFYLEEFMRTRNVSNVFHLEYDNMLYVDLSELLPACMHYKGIAAIFDTQDRCVPNFMYIPHQASIQSLVKFIAQQAKRGLSDMNIIGFYRKLYNKEFIDSLPIIPKEYDAFQKSLTTPALFSNNIEQFNSIFDGAALGQYLDGIDQSIHGPSAPGFINPDCIFNASKFSIVWLQDSLQRKVPYIEYRGKKYRINNLHIHSKNLSKFKS